MLFRPLINSCEEHTREWVNVAMWEVSYQRWRIGSLMIRKRLSSSNSCNFQCHSLAWAHRHRKRPTICTKSSSSDQSPNAVRSISQSSHNSSILPFNGALCAVISCMFVHNGLHKCQLAYFSCWSIGRHAIGASLSDVLSCDAHVEIKSARLALDQPYSSLLFVRNSLLLVVGNLFQLWNLGEVRVGRGSYIGIYAQRVWLVCRRVTWQKWRWGYLHQPILCDAGGVVSNIRLHPVDERQYTNWSGAIPELSELVRLANSTAVVRRITSITSGKRFRSHDCTVGCSC